MTDGAELILSKSSIEAWLSCKRKYLYAYVYRIPGAPSIDMAIGTAIHAGAEAHWTNKNPASATERALAREMALGAALEPNVAAEALLSAHAMTKTYLAKIAPGFHPTIIERDFLIRVDGHLVSGRIDAADDDSVHDTKTTSTPSKVTPERHQLGMTLYSWGYRAITGRLPARLVLDVVARNGRAKSVEVQPDYAGAAEVVGLVARGIESADFEPTGAPRGECHRCPYSSMCGFANLGVQPDVED